MTLQHLVGKATGAEGWSGVPDASFALSVRCSVAARRASRVPAKRASRCTTSGAFAR